MKKTATRHKRGEGNRSEQTAVAPWMLLLQPQQVAQDQQRGAVCVYVSVKRQNALCKRACRSTGLHIRGQRYTGTVSGVNLACILFRPGRSSSAVRLAHPWPNIHQETEACYRKREFKRSLGSTPPYHLFARRGQYPSVMGAMGPLLTAGKAHTSADRA